MSSKIDGIPRELLERIAGDSYQDSLRAVGELRDLLAAPVVERQPVAWANWKVDTKSYVPFRTLEEAERSVKASEVSATQLGPYEVVRLYTATPELAELQATIDKLREGIAEHWKVVCDQRSEIERLKGGQGELVSLDERAEFEASYKQRHPGKHHDIDLHRDEHGNYKYQPASVEWPVWQARACLDKVKEMNQ